MESPNSPDRRNRGAARPGRDRVHRSAARGFERQTGAYDRGRPSYHPAIAERVAEMYGHKPDSDQRFVEVGAGTGIFTEQLIEAGLTVTAIEPVPKMRAALRQRSAVVEGIEVVDGTAERIPLDDRSAATVIAAQAFHWFDYAAALDEFARVLAIGGHLVTVWNVRDNLVPWVAGCTAVLARYAGDTPRHQTMRWRRAIDGDDRFATVEDFGIDNPWPTTPEGVIDRTTSTSFIGELDPDQLAVVTAEIAAIIEPLGPSFDYPYISELQAWRFDGPS